MTTTAPEDEELRRKQFIKDAEHLQDIKNRIHPEPYEFEAMDTWVRPVILARTQALYCEYCIHRGGGDFDCRQRWCDALDRVRNRLWKAEG